MGNSKASISSLLVSILFSVSAISSAAPGQTDPATGDDNGYIFVLNDSVAYDRIPEIAKEMIEAHAGHARHVFQNTVKGFSANMSARAAARLAQNPMIAYYEKNGIARAAVLFDIKKGKPSRTDKSSTVPQVIPYGIIRVGGSRDGTGLHAWIIDTGIDLDNADLNVGPGANMVSRGKDTTDDGNGHGTHVAGTIAAIDNAIDSVGVAANATVHPIRVLANNGFGDIDDIVAGIDYVAANAESGDVANMSLGAYGHFQSLHDAVVRLADSGVKVSVAAGNESDHAGFHEPAHIEHPNVYTVSAIDDMDVFAWFSNYGNPPVDYAAPGVDVASNKAGGGLVSYSGTSMATPHIAGLLLFSVPSTNGTAINDPDGDADLIGYQ